MRCLRDRVELPRLYLAWHGPQMFAEHDAELDLAADLLAHGKTSRLYKTLVYEKQIATDVVAYQHSREISGLFQIATTAAPRVTLGDLYAIVMDTCASWRRGSDGGGAGTIPRSDRAQVIYRCKHGGFGGKSDSECYKRIQRRDQVLRRRSRPLRLARRRSRSPQPAIVLFERPHVAPRRAKRIPSVALRDSTEARFRRAAIVALTVRSHSRSDSAHHATCSKGWRVRAACITTSTSVGRVAGRAGPRPTAGGGRLAALTADLLDEAARRSALEVGPPRAAGADLDSTSDPMRS